MLNSFSSFCDDLYCDMYVNTELDLPTERSTILTFFERLQRQYPSMADFGRRSDGAYCIEENRDTGHYRWVAVEKDRIGSGLVNPRCREEAAAQHKLVLELMPYMLGVSHLDVHSLDVTLAMDFDYAGNQDEVIAEALFSSSAFSCLIEPPYSRCINFSPVMVVNLSADCRTQARISVESRTGVYEPDTKSAPAEGDPIGLSLTVRQYPSGQGTFDPVASFEYQCRTAEQLMAEKVIPCIVKPLINVIARKGLS